MWLKAAFPSVLSGSNSTLKNTIKSKSEGLHDMSDKEQIKEVVTSVAQLQDMKQWERLENYFVKKPFVDNKAINGEMPAVIPKKRLIDSWRKEIGSYFY